jgi:hypothetical protein
MKENEIPIVAGPCTDYMDVLVSALHEELIPARIAPIEDVDPANRPKWAQTRFMLLFDWIDVTR